jgi:hypothetical protein
MKGSRESILSIQGLFELAHSPLRHIVLSPTKRNLTMPSSSSLFISSLHLITSSEHTLHAELKKFLPLHTEQYNVLLKLSKTLFTDSPSLNVIEGAPGNLLLLYFYAVYRYLIEIYKCFNLFPAGIILERQHGVGYHYIPSI